MVALPRIAAVDAVSPRTVKVRWKGGGSIAVDLTGWIATGGPVLAALNDPAIFATAHVSDHGTAIGWGDDEDLAIDAAHVEQLAKMQQPFSGADFAIWMNRTGMSNQEAAAFLGVAKTTVHSYKRAKAVPQVIAMACRVAERDPLLMQAFFQPSVTGRPRTRTSDKGSLAAGARPKH